MLISRASLASGILVLTLSLGRSAGAAETFEYPELNVTPRASDRLELEAKREDERRWSTHLSIQASALTTFVSGLLQSSNVDLGKDADERSPLAGMLVGGSWLAFTTYLALTDQPYNSGFQEVKNLPRKTTREQLTRERMAEEVIAKRGRLGRTLKWLSVGTNFAAGAYMVSKAQSGTISVVADGLTLAMAFAPVLFPYHWEDVANEQADYKKRIYAPVAQGGWTLEPATGKPAPTMLVTFRF